MAKDIKVYRIFIASLHGLEVSESAFRDVIEDYNRTEAIHRGFLLDLQHHRWTTYRSSDSRHRLRVNFNAMISKKDSVMGIFRRSGRLFHVSSKNTTLARESNRSWLTWQHRTLRGRHGLSRPLRENGTHERRAE